MEDISLVSWGLKGKDLQAVSDSYHLPLTPGVGRYLGKLECTESGTLIGDIISPRPLRIWMDNILIVDEPLWWRSFQRQVRCAVIIPVSAGDILLEVEVGERPRHPEYVDKSCPSRNRENVLKALMETIPDELSLDLSFVKGESIQLSLRYLPGQFIRDGIVYQEVVVRELERCFLPPSYDIRNIMDWKVTPYILRTDLGRSYETGDNAISSGLRRVYLPVATTFDSKVVRQAGPETRPEPRLEVIGTVTLTTESGKAPVSIKMPVYETLGRLAPKREFTEIKWPTETELWSGLPEPVLPEELTHFHKLYREAWAMIMRLIRHPKPESGLPNSYITTSGSGFTNEIFVWDSSFTAMATAYGWRVFPVYATLDVLYSRQFDGGYIHREHDVRDGQPILFEPDFSPNPPIMSLADLAIANLSGNIHRLRLVYPALAENYKWLEANRRLPDGTYWTTGLANGLDNSPSLGEGYPDLTAQMAHNAEVLGTMATILGKYDEAKDWYRRRDDIAAALNKYLWSLKIQFYCTSLPGGGHNPNKVVTGFWPLWAGVVPPERVEALAFHLKNPASFWRHHPIPSLSADSPFYEPDGNYWLGSTWAPTNYAAIKGFWRAGKTELSRETALRHLQCMWEVLEDTGFLWENYCAERSAPGNIAGKDYSWSALGPIALLFEVIIGLEPDAIHHRLRFTPKPGWHTGAKNYPLGPCTINIYQEPSKNGDRVVVETDYQFELEVVRNGMVKTITCNRGRNELVL